METELTNVICVTKGKDSSTWGECKQQLEAHRGKAENITEICMDMSPAFIEGAGEHFPNSAITFDKFHIVHAANERLMKYAIRNGKAAYS